MAEKLKESDRAENTRPVPSQAEGDEETIDKALSQKKEQDDKGKKDKGR